MKQLVLFIEILVFASLSSCEVAYLNSNVLCKLDFLVDRYLSVNYDLPQSKESFKSFCENDIFSAERLGDTLNDIIDFLDKDCITWQIDDNNFPKQELIVLSHKDTIFRRVNCWRFPCIGYYNDAFVDCYLKEPSSIYEFLSFCEYCDSVSTNSFWPFRTCDSITIINLRRCTRLNSIEWQQDTESLYFIINNDTLWHHNTTSPCKYADKTRTFAPHYYNKKRCFVAVSEDLDIAFRANLRDLSKPFIKDGGIVSDQIQILEFDSNFGLHPFCNYELPDYNNKWFLCLEQYLHVFAKENNFEKIIFSVPIVEP